MLLVQQVYIEYLSFLTPAPKLTVIVATSTINLKIIWCYGNMAVFKSYFAVLASSSHRTKSKISLCCAYQNMSFPTRLSEDRAEFL